MYTPRYHQDLYDHHDEETKIFYKSYRLSAITDKAGAGVFRSSVVQGGQVVHQARLGVLGDSLQSPLWCIPVIAACDYVVIPNLYTTGLTAV